METWRFHPVSTLHEVSDLGRVRNTRTGRVLDGQDNRGYRRVTLNNKAYYVHRLVWEAFRGPIVDQKMQVDHIDSVRDNNAVTNLQLLTPKEHGVKTAKSNVKGPKRKGRAVRRLGPGDTVIEYPSMHAALVQNPKALASLIARSAKKKMKHVGYLWEFVRQMQTLEGEVWEQTSGRVTVSNLGRVRNTWGEIITGHAEKGGGYFRVWVNGNRKLVHVLVCEAFHGPRPSPKHTVDHIDRNIHNNAASNLRWATGTEQIKNRRLGPRTV